MNARMETVLRLVLTAFFVLSGAACLPQAVPTGAPADVRSADGGAPDSGAGDSEEPGAEVPSPSGKFADASSGPAGSITFESGPSPMQAGDAVPTHDPTGHSLTVATGEKDITCTLPNGLKSVHSRGRVGLIVGFGVYGFQVDPDSVDAEQASKSLMVNMPDARLRVIYSKGPAGTFYRDFTFLSSLPSDDGTPRMTALDPSNARIVYHSYFDLNVATSDPDRIRYVVFKPYHEVPGTSEQPCQSADCIDGASVPQGALDRLVDISDPDPLPPCFEPKMEMMGR